MTYDRIGTAQFTAEQADASEIFFFEVDDQSAARIDEVALRAKIREILGYTFPYGMGNPTTGPVDGKLLRELPMAHPIYNTLYAYNVAVKPVEFGYDSRVSPARTDLEAPMAPLPANYAFWDTWEFNIKFTPRPFAVLDDTAIEDEAGEATWVYGTNGDMPGRLAGQSDLFKYYPEWLRYVETETLPRQDILKWKRGQMVLRAELFDPTPYPATPNWPLPNNTLKLIWYQVPYRYIRSRNSYLRRFLYHINQHAISLDGTDYQPGELLYTNYAYQKHTHPIAQADPTWPGNPSTEKNINVTLEFIVTRRISASGNIVPFNANWIVGGHNLLPWAHNRQYYYATSMPERAEDVNNTALWIPQYKSFPFSLLFKDPDAGLMA